MRGASSECKGTTWRSIPGFAAADCAPGCTEDGEDGTDDDQDDADRGEDADRREKADECEDDSQDDHCYSFFRIGFCVRHQMIALIANHLRTYPDVS